MGTIFSFVSVAGLFAPMCGGALYTTTGYRGVFGVSIGLICVDLVLRVLMVEKTVAAMYVESQSSVGETDGTLGHSEQAPLLPKTSTAHKRYELSKPSNQVTQSLPILLLLRDPGLLTAIWIAFTQTFLLGSFDATVPLVAREQFGFNSLKSGLLFLPLGGADFLLGPVFGWCVDRYGTKAFSILGFMWLVPSLILLQLPTAATSTAANGIGLAIINSPSIVEAGDIVGKYWLANKDIFEQVPYAQLYGINSMVFSGGLTLGPLLSGYLNDKIGYANMNAVLAGLCGLTAILTGIFMGRQTQDLDDDRHCDG